MHLFQKVERQFHGDGPFLLKMQLNNFILVEILLARFIVGGFQGMLCRLTHMRAE